MKKKIMAVTLCLAMVSTFAVGCGQKNETDSGKSEEKSSGKVEIEFVQVKREAAESYTKVIEAFEKENPDIVIKQNVVPDAQEVLMTRASSDSLPDMMNHWPTDAQFVQFEDEGVLLGATTFWNEPVHPYSCPSPPSETSQRRTSLKSSRQLNPLIRTGFSIHSGCFAQFINNWLKNAEILIFMSSAF